MTEILCVYDQPGSHGESTDSTDGVSPNSQHERMTFSVTHDNEEYISLKFQPVIQLKECKHVVKEKGNKMHYHPKAQSTEKGKHPIKRKTVNYGVRKCRVEISGECESRGSNVKSTCTISPNRQTVSHKGISSSNQHENLTFSVTYDNKEYLSLKFQPVVKVKRCKHVVKQNQQKIPTRQETQSSEKAKGPVKRRTAKELPKCRICLQVFHSAAQVKKHFAEHPGEKQYACNLCEHTSLTKLGLSNHKSLHFGNRKSVKSRCRICHQDFPSATALDKHFADHPGEKPHICHLCGHTFVSRTGLLCHKLVHSGEKRFQCLICLKRFTQQGALINHNKVHTNERPFQCAECGKRLASKDGLKVHLRIHTGEKPYQCTFCQRRFSDPSTLQKHTRTHTGEKPHKCPMCPKSFSQTSILRRHLATHTGEKPFICNVCSKRFSHPANLAMHRRVHTNERPFCCKVCGKSFTQSSTLLHHRRIHTKEKPFTCTLCGTKFGRSDVLKNHMLTHTNEKPYCCDICPAAFKEIRPLNRHKAKFH